MTGRWITPAEAEKLIASHMGVGAKERHKARNQLEAWIERRAVQITALERTVLTSAADASGLARTVEHDVPISADEWVAAILSTDNSSLWTIGELVAPTTSGGLPNSRVVYSGVRLSKDDLEARFELAGWAVRQPAASSAMPTAGAVTECQAWLKLEFAKPETGNLKKADSREMAQLRFGQRLSDRSFNRAWANTTPSFPERAKPGAPKKS